MRRECRKRFPPPPISKETASKPSRHASRHVRDVRVVMHVGIAYLWWQGKRSQHSRRMRTRNFAYLVRGPLSRTHREKYGYWTTIEHDKACMHALFLLPTGCTFTIITGHLSLSGMTSYSQISWSPEAAKLDVIMIVLLWHFSRHLGSAAADVPIQFQNDW